MHLFVQFRMSDVLTLPFNENELTHICYKYILEYKNMFIA